MNIEKYFMINLSNQCRPWWNASLCNISSGSLLAKVPVYQYPDKPTSHVILSAFEAGSYMSAHVLLILLEMGERDKSQGLPSILSLFLQRV